LRYALWCHSIPPDRFDLFLFNQWPLLHVVFAPSSIRSKAAIDWCEFRKGSLFSIVQRYLPKLVHKNIANSRALKAEFEALSNCSFEFLPSGIFPNQYKKSPRSLRQGILYLGRITEHKNLALLLSAFESLAAKGYRGRLRIAGGGPALPRVRSWAKASQVANNIDIMGIVDEQSKLDLLANSELLLLTSWREGFPRVVAEAIGSGLPVVTADYPENGTKDLVLQYRIGKVTLPSAGALSDAMLEVLEDWDEYSAACIAASYALDWDALIDQFLQIAESVRKIA
jgi:glycosyltransferase involved in cell wall biosynthesis